MVNSVDPDKIPHMAAFHQGLHSLVSQKTIFRERNIMFVEIITCDPSIYTMDHPDLTVSSLMENFIGLKRVKTLLFFFSDLLVLGVGDIGRKVSPDVYKYLRAKNINFEILPTVSIFMPLPF